MPGIGNQSIITMDNLTQMVNTTNPAEIFVNVNHYIYDGWLFFVLLLVLWAILYRKAQAKEDQILNNLMYSGAVVTIISFVLRAVYVSVNMGLLTDYQLWIFPIITIMLAMANWATKG